MTLQDLLDARGLPPVDLPPSATGWWHRHMELQQLLCREAYGRLPAVPTHLSVREVLVDERFCAGKAPLRQLRLTVSLPAGQHSFPVSLAVPKGKGPHPLVIYISFRPNFPDKYLPVEEICDRGWAVASFCYKDVTADNSDFHDGLAGALAIDRTRPDASGKLMLWAWAAMRVLDHLRTLPDIDSRRVAVAGHSRLAKAALLAGGLDTRFFAVLANEPGTMGAALTRGKTGEQLEDVCEAFPHFFCPRLQDYAKAPHTLPFDQHQLLALVAPRKLYVASAELDFWVDPASEFLGCRAADAAWQALGVAGLSCPDRMPQPGEVFAQGALGYHLRPGEHYLSRFEWQQFLDFLE